MMKKILLIFCICALILSMCACAGKKANSGISDNIVEGETGGENIPDITVETFESTVLSEGGTEPGLWPSEDIPEKIPEFSDYSVMYNASYQNDTSTELWCLGFDSTPEAYNAWIEKIKEAGFRKSDKIDGYWANGDVILDVFGEAEDDGTFYVSIDITKSLPIEYPKGFKDIYPEFKTDGTLRYWITKDKSNNEKQLVLSYVCASDFSADIETLKRELADKGFTVTAEQASLVTDEHEYRCIYAGEPEMTYEDRVIFTYFE